MAQRTSGLYHLITRPGLYAASQRLLGADRARRRFVDDLVKPAPGLRTLDVGCGPATLYPYLPDTDYVGFDLNSRHIDVARRVTGRPDRFHVGDATLELPHDDRFDRIIVSALLHHLDDDGARAMMRSLAERLAPGGRLVTLDGVRLDRQRPIARLLLALDSGRNVRTAEGYLGLVDRLPVAVETRRYSDLSRVPYDHFCMVLRPLSV